MPTITDRNEVRRKEIVHDLLEKPHPPGSGPARRLEALGETPDYTPADEGMHWSDSV